MFNFGFRLFLQIPIRDRSHLLAELQDHRITEFRIDLFKG
jgi:hypothetical protein